MEIHLDDIEEVEFPDGSEIIHQGDEPDYLYILVSGVCHVIKDGQRVNIIEVGDVFGELAFMFKRTRAATVVAEGPVVVCRIDGVRLGLVERHEATVKNTVAMTFDEGHTPKLSQNYLRVYVECGHTNIKSDYIKEIKLFGAKGDTLVEIGTQTLTPQTDPVAEFQLGFNKFQRVVAVATCTKHGTFENQMVLSWE